MINPIIDMTIEALKPREQKLSGIVEAMDEDLYHAHPALSSTGARLLLDSPARFKYRQDHAQPHKAAFDRGSAVHAKVLGVGYGVESLDFPDFRTQAAQEARDAAYAAGLIPMLAKDLVIVDDIAEAVLAHPTARALLERPGTPEASVFAHDPRTGVEMRARFDFLPDVTTGRRIAVDLKSIGKTASPGDFSRSVASFGYDVQQGHYLDTLALSEGDGDAAMVFIVIESDAPHLVATYQLDVVWSEMGAAKARRARELFRECTDSGEWPGYPGEIGLLAPPTWAVYEHEEKFG